MSKIFIIVITLISQVTFAQENPELALEDILTFDEMRIIGIDKLSDEEKENLKVILIEKYLQGYNQGNEDGIDLAIEYFSEEEKLLSNAVIESQIDGSFEGFNGETIFKLMNGQIWQQSEYYYTYTYSFMPKVFIFKSDYGYKMKVDGVEKAIGVKQIK